MNNLNIEFWCWCDKISKTTLKTQKTFLSAFCFTSFFVSTDLILTPFVSIPMKINEVSIKALGPDPE